MTSGGVDHDFVELSACEGPRSDTRGAGPSLKRESGIWSTCGHLTWHVLVRVYVKCYHRLRIEGAENLPSSPPFVMIANHSSHLDSIVLGSTLPSKWCDRVFPVAAGDVLRKPRSSRSSRPS